MLKKLILYALPILLLVILLLLLAIPRLIINYIEKNDIDLIDREITLKDIDLNYFRGSVRVSGLKIFEDESNSSFMAIESMYMNVSITDLLAKKFHIEAFQLDGWEVRIVQNANTFNFQDIVSKIKENSKEGKANANTDESTYEIEIENVEVKNGHVSYSSIINPLLSIDSFAFKLPYYSDASGSIGFKTSFYFSSGGKVNIDGEVDLIDSLFRMSIQTDSIDLKLIEPYLKPVINFKQIKGNYFSKLLAEVSMVQSDYLNLSGFIRNEDFELIDSRDKKILSNKLFELRIDTVQLSEAVYELETIMASGILVEAELYEGGSTFSDLTVKDTLNRNNTEYSDAEVAEYENPFLLIFNYLKGIVKSYDESSYELDHFVLKSLQASVTDHTLQTKDFHFEIDDATISANGISSTEKSLEINFNALLNRNGKVKGFLRPYTYNPKDLDMEMKVIDLNLKPFSTYTIDYVDYPLENGLFNYDCDIEVRNNYLNSINIVKIEQLEWGKRSKTTKPVYHIPLKLGSALLKDSNGNILIDIPIKGDLSDSNFKFGKVVWQVVKRMIGKAANAPFEVIKRTLDLEPKELNKLQFDFLQRSLLDRDFKKLDEIANLMEIKKELNLEFVRSTKKSQAMEEYAVNEMRFEYLYPDDRFPDVDVFSTEKFQEMQELSKDDRGFVQFVFEKAGIEVGQVSIEKASMQVVGAEKARMKIDRINSIIEDEIRNYLVDEKNIESRRIRFTELPDRSLKPNVGVHEFLVDFWVD